MPTAIELAEQFHASLVGDGSCRLRGLAPLETAKADQISFLSNPLYRQAAIESQAGALIVSQADLSYLQEQGKHSASRVYFLSKNPYATFARIAQWFAKESASTHSPAISPMAVIDSSAVIPSSCHIGPFVQIGPNVRLGERVTLLAHISLGANTVIGDDSLIYSILP